MLIINERYFGFNLAGNIFADNEDEYEDESDDDEESEPAVKKNKKEI